MNSDRIKEIQAQTAHPESQSVYHALMQVWNEVQQEAKQALTAAESRGREAGLREAVEALVDIPIHEASGADRCAEDFACQASTAILSRIK